MRSSRKVAPLLFSACTLALLSLSLAGCGSGSGNRTINSVGVTRIVTGETETVSGTTVATWARLDTTNQVIEAGVTIPLAVIQNPPTPTASRHAGHDASDGAAGPAGAFVVVAFPDAVKATTYLNHFEMHWNPTGHPPERYLVPHFDLHFYNQTLDQVKAVTAPDTIAPNVNQIPTGYLYPGVQETVPEMGVHAVDASEFAPGAAPFSASMVLGYYQGKMTFVEPMITQATLLTKQTITLAVPRPEILGQATRFPTKFTATYNPDLDAYQCAYSDFVSVTQ